MENCIFCKIARDEVPAQKARHEDNMVVSFPDLHPKAPGHTLVIPTEHYQWFQDMPEELYGRLMKAVKKIALQLKAEHAADYIRVVIEGKDVPHVHVHLIPSKL